MPMGTRCTLLTLLLLAPLAAGAQTERTLYREGGVVVVESGFYRILRFRQGGEEVEQSRCDLRRPDFPVYEYTRMQLLGLVFHPRPRSVLVVGLGGGSLSKALAHLLPEAEVHSVEIDPVVAEVARRFFHYREGPRVRTIEGDARDYVQGCERRYDLILLDAFDGLEIPAPLRTAEFYRALERVLEPGGAVVANLHRSSPLYSSDRLTLAEVFPAAHAFAGLGNRVVVCTRESWSRENVNEAAQALEARLGPEYRLVEQAGKLEAEPDFDPGAAVLHDFPGMAVPSSPIP